MYLHVCELDNVGHGGLPRLDSPLKRFGIFHSPRCQRGLKLGIAHVALKYYVGLRPQIECYGKKNLIGNREWAKFWALDNPANAIRSRGKIHIWALESTKGSRVGETQRVKATSVIKQKSKNNSIG